MKTITPKYAVLGLSILMTIFLFSACSKKKDPEELSPKSGLSMKVNGEAWQATLTTLISDEHQSEQFGGYHLVHIMGGQTTQTASGTNDDTAESLTMFIAIPASKFRNPKGIYPIVWQSSADVNEATAIFASSKDLRSATTFTAGTSGESGSIEITGFEIGAQKVMGHPTGNDGYIKLSGKFHMNLSPLEATGAAGTLKITEGSFNLTGGIGITL